jgi:outer membrane protein assembly factor BamB
VSRLNAQSAPQWRYAASAEISSFAVTAIGNVLVRVPGQLAALDPTTGAVSWRRDSLQGSDGHWWALPLRDTPYGVIDFGDRLEVIDLQTGTRRWDTTTLAIGTPRGYVAAPERGLLLVYGAIQDSGTLAAVDLSSGELRWRHANPFKEPPKRSRELTSGQTEQGSSLAEEAPVLWVTDSTFLLHVSEDGPVLVNAGTGAFLWRADDLKGKPPPAVRNLYPPSLIADSVVYVPTERELYAIKLRDGTALWSAPVGLPSRVLQLELTPQGLLVRGVRREKDAIRDGSFVDLLDPATGASRWHKQFKKGWSVLHSSDAPKLISPFVLRGERVYCVTDEKLYALSLGDGSAVELGKVKLKDDEEPAVLESRGDGLLLLSPQNVLLADTTGAVRYQSYYPAPPMGLLGQIGTVLLQVAFDVASYSVAQSRANRTGVPQTYRVFDNPFLRIRYAAAAAAQDYVYILTSEKDSTGETRSSVVKVSKDRNRVEGRVWLKDKHPPFAVDPIASVVYVKAGDQELAAFRF